MAETKIVNFTHRENSELRTEVEMALTTKRAWVYTDPRFYKKSRAAVAEMVAEDWVKAGLLVDLRDGEFWDNTKEPNGEIVIMRNVSHDIEDDDRKELMKEYGY